MKNKGMQLGAMLAAMLLVGIAIVSIVSAQADNSDKNISNEPSLAFEFENITKIKVRGATSISELEIKGIQNPNELNIPPSIKKYDAVTFNQVELNSKIKKVLQIRIKGERYNVELKRMNFENIDDGVDSYEGKLTGVVNSEIILTTSDNAISGRVTVDNETFWIRPVEPRKRLENGKSPLHIIYSSKDMESPKIPATIDNGTVKAPYTLKNKPAGLQNVTIQSYVQVNLLVGTDNQFYTDETNWVTTAQGIIAEANNQFNRNDMQAVLHVVSYDDSKRFDLSNNASITSQPLQTFAYYFNNQYLNSKSADISIYLGGYDVDGNVNGAAFPYPNSRHAWAQMVRDWWGGGWTYDGSDHGRRVVTIHEIGHMFDADHEDTGGYTQATYWWDWGYYYTVMWSTYKGSSGTYEFSSINYHGDSTHDNARRIRETKTTVGNYI